MNRILVLDGAMGTMIQRGGVAFEGPADALVLSHPEVISDIHNKYLAAGADIISTNSFNANAVSLADFELAERVYDINFAAARLARAAADSIDSTVTCPVNALVEATPISGPTWM